MTQPTVNERAVNALINWAKAEAEKTSAKYHLDSILSGANSSKQQRERAYKLCAEAERKAAIAAHEAHTAAREVVKHNATNKARKVLASAINKGEQDAVKEAKQVYDNAYVNLVEVHKRYSDTIEEVCKTEQILEKLEEQRKVGYKELHTAREEEQKALKLYNNLIAQSND